MALAIVYHEAYAARLPASHRFPMGKFKALKDVLIAEGLATEASLYRPDPIPARWLDLAHEPGYVNAVLRLELPPETERRIGLPITREVVKRACFVAAGTVLTARLALERGLAANTAGGSHHARRDTGSGFCTFNDVGVAASVLLREGQVRRVLVIDLDVHQGDGTAHIFSDDPRVFTFSMHSEKNFPVRKVPSDLDVGLEDELGDEAYLETLRAHVPRLVDEVRPDLVFYIGGVDPHKDDRLGRLSLSDEGLAARDRHVLSACRDRAVPVACVIGGGYGHDVNVIARRHATLHRTAAEFVRSAAPSAWHTA